MNVLSIDFDYFVRDHPEDDWAQREAPFFIEQIWAMRAADLYRSGLDPIRDRGLASNPGLFWIDAGLRRWRFALNPKVAVAESHASAFHFLKDADDLHIVNVDAHHDLYYDDRDKPLSCANWLWHLAKAGKLKSITTVYPRWRALWNRDFPPRRIIDDFKKLGVKVRFADGVDKAPKQLTFDRVFVARSGAWVPPWLDESFVDFFAEVMGQIGGDKFETYGYDSFDGFLARKVNLAEAKANGEKMAAFMEQAMKGTKA